MLTTILVILTSMAVKILVHAKIMYFNRSLYRSFERVRTNSVYSFLGQFECDVSGRSKGKYNMLLEKLPSLVLPAGKLPL